MKLTYEFDENEIIEKVKEDSEGYSSLKEEIIREIKQRVVHKFVSQIESETVDRSYSREWFTEEIKKQLLEKTHAVFEKFLENSLSEKNIESFVKRKIEAIMSRWIEKKVYERLEQIKGDILFVSGLEVQEEAKYRSEQEEHAYEAGVEEGSRNR